MAKTRNKTWKDAKHTLEQRRTAILELVAEYTPQDTIPLLKTIQHLREQQDELELRKQRISERLDAITQVVADRWEAEDIKSMDVEGVGSFSVQSKLHVTTADKEAYHAWLKENELAELIQQHVPPKTTEALVRERLEDGKPHEGMGLTVFFKTVIR